MSSESSAQSLGNVTHPRFRYIWHTMWAVWVFIAYNTIWVRGYFVCLGVAFASFFFYDAIQDVLKYLCAVLHSFEL